MIIWFQPPCCVQGCIPLDQAAQSHIQPGLECLQGWGIHNLSGQLEIAVISCYAGSKVYHEIIRQIQNKQKEEFLQAAYN